MGIALALLGRVPFWVWPAVLICLWGWWGNHQAAVLRRDVASQAGQLKAANERTRAAEHFRQAERQAATKQREIADALSKAQTDRSRLAAAVDRRLQQLADDQRAAGAAADPAAACRGDGAPAVAALPDQARRDLVALADEADATADRLTACQRYVTEVVPLASTPPLPP
ncbi:MAG: hypothetical protein ACOZJZ_12715 [Pseudomonadota bacterium]